MVKIKKYNWTSKKKPFPNFRKGFFAVSPVFILIPEATYN